MRERGPGLGIDRTRASCWWLRVSWHRSKLWGNNQSDFRCPRKLVFGVSRSLLPTGLFAVSVDARLVLVLISVNSGPVCQHRDGALLVQVHDVRYWRNALARTRLKKLDFTMDGPVPVPAPVSPWSATPRVGRVAAGSLVTPRRLGDGLEAGRGRACHLDVACLSFDADAPNPESCGRRASFTCDSIAMYHSAQCGARRCADEKRGTTPSGAVCGLRSALLRHSGFPRKGIQTAPDG